MQRHVRTSWGSYNDLRDLTCSSDDHCCHHDHHRGGAGGGGGGGGGGGRSGQQVGAAAASPPPRAQKKRPETESQRRGQGAPDGKQQDSRQAKGKQMEQKKQQQEPENRHRPLTRLSQLQKEGNGLAGGTSSSSAVGRYSLSPPRLFPPAELPPVGRLRRVFTTHTRRRKKHAPGFQLTNLMKEPLRVVHSVPLCFPEG